MTTSFKLKLFRDDIELENIPDITSQDALLGAPVIVRDQASNINDVRVNYAKMEDSPSFLYMFVATGSEEDIQTFEIGDTESNALDYLNYGPFNPHNQYSPFTEILHVANDVYVMTFRDDSLGIFLNPMGWWRVQTFSVDEDGIITLIDSWALEERASEVGGLTDIGGGVFACGVTFRYGRVSIFTFSVSNEGEISSNYLDEEVIDAGGRWGEGRVVDGCATQVGPSLFAFVYNKHDPGHWQLGDLMITVLHIYPTGSISAWSTAVVEPGDPATLRGNNGRIIGAFHTLRHTFAVYYRTISPEGIKVKTFRITLAGITELYSEIVVEGSFSQFSHKAIKPEGLDKIAVSYTLGGEPNLWMKTYLIAGTGNITLLDTKNFPGWHGVNNTCLAYMRRDKYVVGSGPYFHSFSISNDGIMGDVIQTLHVENVNFFCNDLLRIKYSI